MVSLGDVSSSITSSIGRPAIPPAALYFPTAHSVALRPLIPGLAAIPVRGTRMPSLQGLAWAMAGAPRRDAAARALVAVMDFRTARRVIVMGSPRWLGASSQPDAHA